MTYLGKFNSLVKSRDLKRTAPIGTVPNPKDSAATTAYAKAIPVSCEPTIRVSRLVTYSWKLSGVLPPFSKAILAL